MDTKNEVKTSNRLYGTGFWATILILVGFIGGVMWSQHSMYTKFEESVNLGGIVHNSKVYDIKERVIQ